MTWKAIPYQREDEANWLVSSAQTGRWTSRWISIYEHIYRAGPMHLVPVAQYKNALTISGPVVLT